MGCYVVNVFQSPEHLTITNKRLPLNSTYRINNSVINKATHAKYLGVTVSQNLSWSKHIDNITSKVNSVHALLQRNRRQCSHQVKSLAYFTYTRPILEYASIVWSPHTKVYISLRCLSVKPPDLFVITILDTLVLQACCIS